MLGELRYCSPRAKTQKFAVILPDWRSLKLDSRGNEMASQYVRRAPKHSAFRATVCGTLDNKKTIQVSALTATAARRSQVTGSR